VQPELNRVSADGEEVQLEPRGMDLLVFLAEHAGEVMSRQDILDAVWQQDFVGDTTLSSAIAVLRRTLDDDARDPRYIETIAKRGYRLVAEVVDPETVATVTPFPGLVVPREPSPYPGLAAFTESDAELFFGREQEAAALWRKIPRQNLLAVIGPSGVGKSSFVRAGVMPSAPEGWGTLVFEPGEAPFNSLARALAPEFSGDTEAVQQLLACRDPDVALSLVSRWRDRWSEALLVVDQFEELFTLNSAEAQTRFAELLSRLAHAAHVHIVLVMRDDFLYDCHAHAGLADVYKDLTVLGPLAAEDLQRAIVEPARHSGYSFEDEDLAEEMLAEVAGERGATPLLAFSMSRLWELRDRGRRLITRSAFEKIGGVGGALAQHAEEIMTTLGDDSQQIIREIFRNLVTGQGTRAAREAGELLSVFTVDQQTAATEILQELVSGRLLTAFEVHAAKDESTSTHHRVEIVHESLLTTWPRLVRWQTQDADAVQLRDQVRQAAMLWDDHGRSEDLLWSGTAYRELLLWREHYPGGLSAVEEDFTLAMTSLAGRRRGRRRTVVVVGFVVAIAVAAAMTALWWTAVREARRADAKQLFLRGKVDLDFWPIGCFTDAVASLERADDPEVRRFALEALWRTPMPVQGLWTDSDRPMSIDFSPDGRWLAAGYFSGTVRMWSASGGEPVTFQTLPSPVMARFAPDSLSLAAIGIFDTTYRFFSVPGGQPLTNAELGSWPPARDLGNAVAYGNIRRLVRIVRRPGVETGAWTVDSSRLERLSRLQSGTAGPAAIDPAGEKMVFAKDGTLFIAGDEGAAPRRIARHELSFEQMAYHPDGELVATVDTTGAVQLWSLVEASSQPVRTFKGNRGSMYWDLNFDPTGALLAATQESGETWVWGLDDPPGAEPMSIATDWDRGVELDFDPSGRWLARAGKAGAVIWPIDRRRFGYVLRGHSGPVEQLAFAANSSSLVSAAVDGEVRLWSVQASSGVNDRVLVQIEHPVANSTQLAISPDGSFVALPTGHGTVQITPVDGGPVRELAGFGGRVLSAAVSLDGRLVAAGGGPPDPSDAVIRVWSLETGEVTVLDGPDGEFVLELSFTSEDELLAAAGGNLYRWVLTARQPELLFEDVFRFALSRNGRDLVVLHSDLSASLHNLETGTTVRLEDHGDILQAVAIAADGRIVVTGDRDRVVRVGSADGGEPHLLYGHRALVKAVAVSPDGRWIASGARDGAIRLWPVPSGRPFHTLPRQELLERLRALRTYRRVPSQATMSGLIIEFEPFRGWETVPEW
ncbi:MAG: winged helix-turn-helix domain-containing protein, partial [Acidobacteria bacterium]|nr:winged helix-turn-helix domain-containing protein [Acidobacteriota bacterium]